VLDDTTAFTRLIIDSSFEDPEKEIAFYTCSQDVFFSPHSVDVCRLKPASALNLLALIFTSFPSALCETTLCSHSNHCPDNHLDHANPDKRPGKRHHHLRGNFSDALVLVSLFPAFFT